MPLHLHHDVHLDFLTCYVKRDETRLMYELILIPQCDRENRLTYLESSNPLNLKLYGRLGFKFAKKIHLTRGQKLVEMDIMTRVPAMREVVTKASDFAEEIQEQQMKGN